jgi:hypothetical protein
MSTIALTAALLVAVAAPTILSLVFKPSGDDRGARVVAAFVGAKGAALVTLAALLD